jgi:hypothetical protein
MFGEDKQDKKLLKKSFVLVDTYSMRLTLIGDLMVAASVKNAKGATRFAIERI